MEKRRGALQEPCRSPRLGRYALARFLRLCLSHPKRGVGSSGALSAWLNPGSRAATDRSPACKLSGHSPARETFTWRSSGGMPPNPSFLARWSGLEGTDMWRRGKEDLLLATEPRAFPAQSGWKESLHAKLPQVRADGRASGSGQGAAACGTAELLAILIPSGVRRVGRLQAGEKIAARTPTVSTASQVWRGDCAPSPRPGGDRYCRSWSGIELGRRVTLASRAEAGSHASQLGGRAGLCANSLPAGQDAVQRNSRRRLTTSTRSWAAIGSASARLDRSFGGIAGSLRPAIRMRKAVLWSTIIHRATPRRAARIHAHRRLEEGRNPGFRYWITSSWPANGAVAFGARSEQGPSRGEYPRLMDHERKPGVLRERLDR